MRIVFVGDVFGRSGREALEKHLPDIKDKLQPDVVIVNGENAANGAGITEKICKQFYDWGTDVITTGNHIWDQREIIPYITRDEKLLRPMNYPEGSPGNGVIRFQTQSGQIITIVNAMCRLFMDAMDDPFKAMKKLTEQERLGENTNAILLDFHGETTSEKMSMAHYLDGKVSAVIGTHTHAPTADHQVLPGGTAFMSDAGMTGDYNSVIGVEKEIALNRFVKKMPGERFRPSSGEATLCGAFVVTNDDTGLAQSIEPIRIGGRLSQFFPLL